MPDRGNGHPRLSPAPAERTQREIELDLAQHRAHLGEAVERLSQIYRQTFDIKARARVLAARARQQVRLHTWPFLVATLAVGALIGVLMGRRVLSP